MTVILPLRLRRCFFFKSLKPTTYSFYRLIGWFDNLYISVEQKLINFLDFYFFTNKQVFVFYFLIFNNFFLSDYRFMNFGNFNLNFSTLSREKFDYSRISNVTHSVGLEILWTFLPALVLFFIAIPSFMLLYSLDEPFFPEFTVKIVAHQWFWSYEYDADILKELLPNYYEKMLLEVENLYCYYSADPDYLLDLDFFLNYTLYTEDLSRAYFDLYLNMDKELFLSLKWRRTLFAW